MVTWRKEFTPSDFNFILDTLRKMRVKEDNGTISFRTEGFSDRFILTSILASAVDFDVRTDALRTTIVKRALFSPDLPLDFTEEQFRGIVHKLRNQCQDGELEKLFIVALPVWNLPGFLNKLKKMGDVTLDFSPNQSSDFFKTIVQERNKQQESLENHFTEDRKRDLNKCSLCLASVRANSPADANERASQAVYEILGVLNLVADYEKYWRLSTGILPILPISDVLIGPHTTIHCEDGTLSHDGFWYEDWAGGPPPRTLEHKKMEAWEKNFWRLLTCVDDSEWKKECKFAAALYFKSFSNPNLEASFLEGWRLFENISGAQYEKIDKKILRASHIFKAKNEYHVLGQHLRVRRNLLTHGRAIKANDEETLAFQMRQFVAPFLVNYIENKYKFKSPGEFWEFFDLPVQSKERTAKRIEHERQLDLLEKAKQFYGENS